MTLEERLPSMDDLQLATLHANALRLQTGNDNKRSTEATELIPLIEAELAQRVAAKPPKVTRKRRA